MSSCAKADASSSPALEKAALLGREFSLAWLRAAGVSDPEVAVLFDQVILIPAAQHASARFADPSLPRKIVRTIPWSRARDHHLVLAEAAKQQRLAAEVVAEHFEAAHRFDLARAQWMKAGETSCHAGDYKKALRLISRALAIWPWDEAADDRARVLREMARCATNARLTDEARKAWEELADHARDTGKHDLRADALHQLAILSADPVRAGELLAEASKLATRELGPEEAFRHGLAHVDLLVNRVRVAAAKLAFVAVEEAALKSKNPALQSEMLGWKALIAAMAGEAGDATRFVEEGMQIAITHQLPEQVAFAYKRRANIADYAGQYSLEKHSHNVAIRYCRESQTGEEIVCMGCLSYACFRTGDWKEALDTAREVLGQPDLHPGLRAIAGGVRGMIAAFRGEKASAFRHLDEAIRLQRAEGMVGMEFLTLWALAYWHDCQGEGAKACAIYDEIRTLWRESDDLHDSIPGLLFAGAHYADHGRAVQLADCIDIIGEILRKNDLPEARATLLALGAEQARLEGDHEACDKALREAAALQIKAGLPLEQLWIESRHPRAEDHKGVIALATKLGTKPLLARLKGEDCGDSASGLTPRQCEVLSFLATGLTSKEIGDRMGLSTRTVEMHVSRIFERLNCRTRPEAVALAQARGWIKLP
ncbi:LuxR C-terminal-related transcriptional regulator [Luteolibacter luteus]|uniref:HTH luxR-type domain-containing protein n=1 Tax=Luteolibacter luteus TaxID=2728835 RepID=A0A858RIU9_9BACT|nr:LuxR C-terminal-related transcriptional regulator [Luteolibacter luteus]QJE96349.1 hypothetical protein HHL09_11320 [Luteolibacter luteus]